VRPDPHAATCRLCERRDAGERVDDSYVDTSAGLPVKEIVGFCREDFLAVIHKYVEHPSRGWDDIWWERLQQRGEAERLVSLIHFFVMKIGSSGMAAFIEGLGENAGWYEESEASCRLLGAKRALSYLQAGRRCLPQQDIPPSLDARDAMLESDGVEDCLVECDDVHAEFAAADAIDALRRYVRRHLRAFEAIRRPPDRPAARPRRTRTQRG
jgi:hypothetical protein